MRAAAARPQQRERRSAAGPVRAFFVALVAICLLSGIAGGLLRAGVALPAAAGGAWLTQAVQHHAFLMICTFLGTVIGLERAVALKKSFAFLAPLASALAGGLILYGQSAWAAALAVPAAAVFVAVNIVLLRRQRAAHTVLLLLAAVAWLFGNLGLASGGGPHRTVPWWFAFLVLTIAAERLEMSRLMRQRPGAAAALHLIVAALFAACLLSALRPDQGGLLYGAALLALSAWLFRYDIARRTIRAQGLSRYMALCLLLGYGWLAVAGLAWIATALGRPWLDAAIHALAIGFVFSMIFGHAPVILPALARVKLLFSAFFYLPLALLHLSLAVRLLAPPLGLGSSAAGALGNALAVLLFAATVAGSALAWRLQYPASERLRRHVTDTDS